mgnify:CR=1 FL=1
MTQPTEYEQMTYNSADGAQAGKAREALASAARTIEAVYAYPYQNHACMEPMNATVRWTPEKCEMWGPTQNGEAALAAVGIKASQLTGHQLKVAHTGLGKKKNPAFSSPKLYKAKVTLLDQKPAFNPDEF